MNINGREVIVYPKESHLRSTEEKWGVCKLPASKRQRRKLLVLGTGRCGTMFTTHALRGAGIRVGHEKVDRDGTVSHYFVMDNDWYPMAPWQEKSMKKHVGERRSDFIFDNTFHIVRNPLKAIPSMVKIFGSVTWRFYEECGLLPEGLTGLHRAAYLWYSHNLLAADQADITFRVEDYAGVWSVLMEKLGMDAPYPIHMKPMNKTGGFRSYEPIELEHLQAIDRKLAANIARMATRYGYEV